MKNIITKPVLEETTTDKIIPKIKEFGENARMIKKYYPSVWGALVRQYGLDSWDKKISDGLFDKKLEVLLLQDEELRK